MEQNKTNPYANNEQKQYLADKTGLSIEFLTNWLHNQRYRLKKNDGFNSLLHSISNNIYLDKYFRTINKYPKKEELIQISKETGLSHIQITRWFSFKRFKEK